MSIRSSARVTASLFATVWLAAAAAAGPLNLAGYNHWTLIGSGANSAFSIVQAPGPDGIVHNLLQVRVTTPSNPFYLIQLSQPLLQAIPAGHLIRYSFWARASNSNSIRAVIEQNGPPYQGYVTLGPTLSAQWHEYSGDGDSPGLAPGAAAARLQVGEQSGTIEFADVQVQDMGQDPLLAQAQAAIQPAAVQARIRRYRMTNLTVTVVDARGRPVPGATVHVQQQSHAFLFGCNIFGLKQGDHSPAQQAYRKEFAALFNYATLPFYWSSFETVEGKPNFSGLTWMAQWCAGHEIATKAHPLVWNQAYPTWWAPKTVDATIPLLKTRVTQIVSRMSPIVKYYDVVNEASDAASWSPPDGESLWIRRDGPAKVVETALRWARAAGDHEGDTFIDNDYETGQPNVALFKQLERDHQLPDAIGIQSHMHAGKWPMTEVWMVCQRFAQFGIPIHFTETTVLSTDTPHAIPDSNAPPATDWVTTPEGERDQARYVVRFYSLLFSHPDVRAITWWDFSDLNAWMGAPAGLVRKDMSPKPAYDALMQLIHHDWWSDVTGRTGPGGAYRARVFYGRYRVTARVNGRTATRSIVLPEASGRAKVVIRLR